MTIDWEQVARLAQIQCSPDEIAYAIGVSEDYLRAAPQFQPAYDKGVKEGKTSLRRMQWRKVLEGNVPMLLRLGDQHLAQLNEPPANGKPLIAQLVEIAEENLNVRP